MGFQEERWSGAKYVTVTTSAANTTNPITGACILDKVIVNAAPTSAFLLYDGADVDGTLVATVAAATAAGTHYDYGIQLGSAGLAVSAQSSDTNIVISYIPIPGN